ncbi:MAG: hypothetical protein ACJ71F_09220 [Nitrososphaeraceae archaeon]
MSSQPHNEDPKCYRVIVAESVIALVGIAIVTYGASLLLVQSAGATTDVLTNTTSVGGEQKAASKKLSYIIVDLVHSSYPH